MKHQIIISSQHHGCGHSIKLLLLGHIMHYPHYGHVFDYDPMTMVTVDRGTIICPLLLHNFFWAGGAVALVDQSSQQITLIDSTRSYMLS